MKRWQISALIVIVWIGMSCCAAGAANSPLRYELVFEKPNTHLLDVTIHSDGLDGRSVEFAIPDWAPGSYYIMDYSANVQGFKAMTQDGGPLTWRKTDSQTWRIELAGAKQITIQYKVYGNTLQNNLMQYDDRHVFFGGPSIWMYQVDGKLRPIELTVAPIPGWKIATGMIRTSPTTFQAQNYDTFADCPFEISDYQEKTFQDEGTTYHVVVDDAVGNADFSKFATDLQKVVAVEVPIFAAVTGTPQPAPFQEYWFLYNLRPRSGGGLEHLNSTQIEFSSDFDDTSSSRMLPTSYDSKLSVSAHEFFHAWNVKRLRPRPLGPFDYTQQVHTPSLWISEGLTSYYADLSLTRAGILKPQEYLDFIAKLITNFEQLPGRSERSIEDTSWDTWYRFVREQTNLENTSYSYYDGGQIMGNLLDLAIRQNTNNQKSLEDWMRLMYSRYALPKPGFEPDDAIRAASEIAGMDMSGFFGSYISGKDAIPYDKYFAYAGIAVEKKADPGKAWLGVSTSSGDNHQALIANVIPGSPAEEAGLSRDDVVVAVDGRSVDADGFGAAIQAKKPGDHAQISVFRLGKLREFTATLRANPCFTYSLKPIENPTSQQKEIYNSWLGINQTAAK